MAPLSKLVLMLLPIIMICLFCISTIKVVTAATWCVARTDANEQALQTALDYACGAGADCAPIQPSGPCYLPDTLVSHSSYAFNSFYDLNGRDPASCTFAGAGTIVTTDPSNGSCVYLK